MTSKPNFKLSRLRTIGWQHWDPISLRGSGWAEDEYDTYLQVAAAKLCNGSSPSDVSQYLVSIERDHMGLGLSDNCIERADATVLALTEYVAELRQR